MKRKIIEKLVEWKNDAERLPLILEGARQVGKTWALEEFGRTEFENYVRVDLYNAEDDIKSVFRTVKNPREILEFIALKYQTPINPQTTLVIFDEIQEVPEALASLKYFAENAPEYVVAAAGSLLGIAIHDGASFPVGKVNRLNMYPMDLEEFFWALGLENETQQIHQSVADGEYPLLYSAERNAFQQYLAVGGMPKAALSWVTHKDITRVDAILSGILADYNDDFGKHVDALELKRISAVWRSIPRQFAKENHKFSYKTVEESGRARDFREPIDWLIDAGLVYQVSLIPHGDKMPLMAYADKDDFKIYTLDVGLLRVLSKLPAAVVIGEDDIWSQFGGAFVEQFVLEQIVALSNTVPYYWVGGVDDGSGKKNRSEVDFVIQDERRIVPIEVKSGENVKAKSLRVYRDKYQPELAVRFSLLGLDYREGLVNIPLYYSFLLPDLMKVSAENVEKLAVFRAENVGK